MREKERRDTPRRIKRIKGTKKERKEGKAKEERVARGAVHSRCAPDMEWRVHAQPSLGLYKASFTILLHAAKESRMKGRERNEPARSPVC